MLSGITVVSVGGFIAGPLNARFLADLGADVIKVENVGQGDPYRHLKKPFDRDLPDDLTYVFLAYNRGKRSIALDLKSEEGGELFVDLVAEADVVVENLSPGQMERFDLGYDRLTDVNEELIYCSITGFGETGPLANRPSVDPIVQALSGMMDLNSREAGEPVLTGIYLADILSGVFGTMSVLSALTARERGEGGTYIDLSMLDSLLALFNHEIAEFSGTGTVKTGEKTLSSVIPQGVYETATRPIALNVMNDEWRAFADALELDDWLASGEYDDVTDRQDDVDVIDARVNEVMSQEPAEYWMERFTERELLAAPVEPAEDAFRADQVAHRDMVRDREDPAVGTYSELGFPALFDGEAVEPADVPRHGEHSREILREQGFGDDTIDELIEADIVGAFVDSP